MSVLRFFASYRKTVRLAVLYAPASERLDEGYRYKVFLGAAHTERGVQQGIAATKQAFAVVHA